MSNLRSNQFNKHRAIPVAGLAILTLLGMTLSAKSTFGQSSSHKVENLFESILISDDRIPDLSASAWSTTWGEDQLKLMIKIKKESLNNRMKHLQLKSDLLQKRMDNKRREMMIEMEKLAPTSRVAAEQLLIAAQLELQKISWDLASETELLKEAKEGVESNSDLGAIERQIAAIEVDGMRQEMDAAVLSLQRAEEMVKGGSISTTEAAKAKEKVAKLKNAFEVIGLRQILAERQRSAISDSQQLEIRSRVRKLSARKQQIERDFADLTLAMQDIAKRERVQVWLDQCEESLAILGRMHDELQNKMDEVNALIVALDAIEIKEKSE